MVDQEEARLENSEAILRNLVSEFKAQGIKIKVVDEDTIAYKGVQFDLLDSPTDTLNGIIYLISPSNQTIPVREENLAETVKMVVDYVEHQRMQKSLRKEASTKKSKKLSKFDFKFDPDSFDRAFEEAMASLNDNPDYKRYSEFMERWNNASGSKPNVVLDADDIRQPIRDWYTSTYPDDELGMNLSDITFHDLHTGISQGLDVYDHIGVGDSIVRERLFERLAELKSVSYNTIYDMWLNGARKGMRKSLPNSRLVDKVAQIIERELPNVSFVGDSMGYEPDIYDWVEGYIYEANQNVDEPWADVESAEDLAEMILDSINGSYDPTVQTPNGDSIRMISKKLSKNESVLSFSQMMKSVKDGSFKAKEISKGASAYAIFEIDGYDERLTRAQSLEGFYSPNVGGHIQTYERGIDVPVMGDVFVSASDIRSEMDYAIQGDFEEIKRGVCEAYDSVYNDVPIESIVFQGYAISNVFVVTEGVNSYARTFSISGGYSHIHLPLGAQIECEGSWYLDVLVTLRFEVNGELIVDSYESTISVDPVLRLHPQGIDAYNTLWESNDDMYM